MNENHVHDPGDCLVNHGSNIRFGTAQPLAR